MNFSEYDKIDFNNERRISRKLVNSLSQIPMFDQIKYSGEGFYQTTYGVQFPAKERFFGKDIESNPYDYQGLSARLANKNDRNSFSSRPMSHRISDNSNSNLMHSDSYNSMNDFNDSSQQLYKRPQIPPYIKRDNFFQTNAEKNISYLQTHTGIFPFVRNRDYQQPTFIPVNKSENGSHKNSLVNFYSDKQSEFKSSYMPKDFAKSNVSQDLALLKKDNTYHTNSERNIKYIRTSNGSIITFVPNTDEIKPELSSDYPNENMNIKHGNPKNQYKRNFSVINQNLDL